MAHMNYNAKMIAEPTYLDPYLPTYNVMPNICQNPLTLTLTLCAVVD